MITRCPVIAVVDDDPRLQESLANLLESAGYDACVFPSAEALLAHGINNLDLLITDIGMPGVSGLILRDIVRESRPELPIFLITGRHEFADTGQKQKCPEVFRKPFDGLALLSAIGTALDDQ